MYLVYIFVLELFQVFTLQSFELEITFSIFLKIFVASPFTLAGLVQHIHVP